MKDKTLITKKDKDGKYQITKEGHDWLASTIDPKDKVKWFGKDAKH